MEVVVKLSKFKLQLQALVSEVRQLRDREHSANEQIGLLTQKQRQAEEESARKLKELQTELDSSNEIRRKLKRKVSSLESDNGLLENKQNELKETVNNLLQSRENFVKVYEDSTYELKQSILMRDKKYAALSEKLNAHISLFDSIAKETSSVKQVVDAVQSHVTEKEGIAAGLRCKINNLSSYKKVFVEKISDLESNLRKHEGELRKRAKKISELEAMLEDAKISNRCQPLVYDLQNMLSLKDVVIEDFLAEKKALQSELWSLGIILQKIQHAITNMDEKDRREFTLVLEGQDENKEEKEMEIAALGPCVLSSIEEHTEVKEREVDRAKVINQTPSDNSMCKACDESIEAKTFCRHTQ